MIEQLVTASFSRLHLYWENYLEAQPIKKKKDCGLAGNICCALAMMHSA